MGVFINGALNLSTSKTVLTPLSIPGCDLWLDSTTGLYDSSNNPITTNNVSIARWDDQSNNGYSFIQPTSIRRPTTVTNSLNGERGVRFDAGSGFAQYLSGGQICNLSGPESSGGSLIRKSFYIALVHKFDNPTPTGTYETILSRSGGYAGYSAGGYSLRRWDYQAGGFSPSQVNRYCMKYDVNGNEDFGFGGYTSTSPTYTLFSIPRTIGRRPFNATIDINGNNVLTQALTQDDVSQPTIDTLHNLIIGTQVSGTAYTPNDGTAFIGKIYEIIIYKRVAPLSLKEITGLRRYIKNKWNI